MYSLLACLSVVFLPSLALVNLDVTIIAWRWMRRHPEGADCSGQFRGRVRFCGIGGLLVMLVITGLIISFLIDPDLHGTISVKSGAAAALSIASGLATSAPALAMHPRFGSKANLIALLSATALLPYALALGFGLFAVFRF